MRSSLFAASLLALLAACSDDGAAADGETDGADSNASNATSGETSDPESDGPTGPDSSDVTAGPEPEDTDDPSGDTDGSGTGEEPACEAVGFGGANVWSLPDVSALPLDVPDALEITANGHGCTNDEQFRYLVMDLTADGVVDFVITDGCDSNGVGQERWIVHPGEDGGFGRATTWTLPDIGALPLDVPDALEVTANGHGCTNGEQFRYQLLDLTADGMSDFVITDGCDANGVGQDRWIVHPGSDGGYGDATTWSLPDLSALPLDVPDPLEVPANGHGCTNEEQFRYQLLDLTGDGVLDFVITDGCDANGVGQDRWIVHPGGADGFGAATTWTLPDISALPLDVPDALEVMANGHGCTNEEQFRFQLMDLTSDGLVDFVITDGCDANGVGQERWIVHPAGDDGFGAATTWTLPDIGALPLDVPDALEITANGHGCTNDEQFRYLVMDLTADGLVDFVITDGCDANGVGLERWIVHPGEDGGFGAATTWMLPDISALPIDVPDALEITANGHGCTNEEQFRYLPMDLTGDGLIDFVLTDGCDANGVGADRWIQHSGMCE